MSEKNTRGISVVVVCCLCSLLVGLLSAPFPVAGAPAGDRPLEWQPNYMRAIQLAKKEDKLVFAYFRGSDWCPYCQKLDKEVMGTSMFERWAKKNVIALEVDFPREARQPRLIQQQNENLKQKYQVAKTPTFLFLDKDGREIARAGWDEAHLRKDEPEGAPSAWMNYLRGVVRAGPEMESIDQQPSLAVAVEFAKAHQTPLLLLVTHGGHERTDLIRRTLLENQSFVGFVNTNCAFVELAWPAEGDSSPEAAAARAFIAKHRIVDRPVQLVMWDGQEDKVTARLISINPARIDLAIQQLEKSLPEISYRGEWITDHRRARAISAQSGREIFMCFSQLRPPQPGAAATGFPDQKRAGGGVEEAEREAGRCVRRARLSDGGGAQRERPDDRHDQIPARRPGPVHRATQRLDQARPGAEDVVE